MTGHRQLDFEIFAAALRLSPEERPTFLERACAGDPEHRQRIEGLLKANDRAGDFLEESPVDSIHEERSRGAAFEQPGDRVGRYHLLQQIGEGGCGVVFLAEQADSIRRRVALKVVKPGMDTRSVIARFEAERQALALMDHPSIAHVFDAGTTATGRPYFVMELVDGIKITEYCDQQALPTRARLELFIQVCDAIQHAHQKGVIHRDIKPSNVLVVRGSNGKPLPKVIDFGLAKAIAGLPLTDKTIFTASEMIIGTPAYMSPEQAAPDESGVDTRTDIYSLGVLLYELLTGTTPFDTQALLKSGWQELCRAVCEEEPMRPSRRLSTASAASRGKPPRGRCAEMPKRIRELRGDLDWIVMKALEKDRRRRYATANGLAMDLERYRLGEAVLARPPSATYRFQKLFLRNRLLFVSAALIFLSLLVALTMSLRLVVSQRRELMLATAGQWEAKAINSAVNRDLEPAVAALRESLAIRREHFGGEPPTGAAEVVVNLIGFYQRRAQALALLNEVLTPAALARPENSRLVYLRAEYSGQDGNWPVALADAKWLVKAQPDNLAWYHLLAPLLVATGDREGYQKLCREIMARFRDTTEVAVADPMAKDCLILPSSGVDFQAAAAMSNLGVTKGKSDRSYRVFQCNAALAQYRLGNYQAAVDFGDACYKDVTLFFQVEVCSVMAMARYKSGNEASAKRILATAKEVFQDMPPLGQDLGQDWRDWIVAHALYAEADQLIHGDSSPATPPADPKPR